MKGRGAHIATTPSGADFQATARVMGVTNRAREGVLFSKWSGLGSGVGGVKIGPQGEGVRKLAE